MSVVQFPLRAVYRQLEEKRGPAVVVILPVVRIERDFEHNAFLAKRRAAWFAMKEWNGAVDR